MTPQTFIFIGRSGCGKGTQAKLIIEYLKKNDASRPVYYLESGEIFRKLIQRDTYTAILSKQIYEEGGLQPEFLAVWAWSNLMIENLTEGEHIVLDGTPRQLREANVLDSALKFYDRKQPNIIYMNVSKAWATERLIARKRSDDQKDDIEVRMSWFERDVMPAIDFFRDNRRYSFHEINGEQPIEKVHEDILQSVSWPK